MRKYFYEIDRKSRSLHMRQYIYWIGPYRYNWHEALELMLILKGHVEMSCGGERVNLEEDDLLLIDSNVGHASLAKEEGSIAMVLHLEPGYLEEYYRPGKAWLFSGNTDEQTRNRPAVVQIRGIMASMITRADSSDPLEKLQLEQELNHLLTLLFRLFPPRKRDRSEALRTEKQKGIMDRILKYVEENYQERITLEDLSRLCQYNTSYLSTYFKNHMGINFYDYLTRIRLREATLELCSTENTVLEIAGRHGFPDVKAFNASFRKAFGKSPKEYRKEILEENRGMDFTEKRKFLPLDHEIVNRKLAGYQQQAFAGWKVPGTAVGAQLLGQELADGIKNQAEDTIRQAREICGQLEALQKKAGELSEMLQI